MAIYVLSVVTETVGELVCFDKNQKYVIIFSYNTSDF